MMQSRASFYPVREFMDPLLLNIKGKFCLKESGNDTPLEAISYFKFLGLTILRQNYVHETMAKILKDFASNLN